MQTAFVGRRWTAAALLALAGLVMMSAAPAPAWARDCNSPAIESCDRDYGDGINRLGGSLGWCYNIRTSMCSEE